MATQPEFNSLEIGLDVVVEGQSRRDRALAQEAGYIIFTHLKEQSKEQGYTIEPANTGTLGAGNEFLVLWQFVHDNQEIIIATIGGTIAILKTIYTKLSKSKELSCVSTTVDLPGIKVTAHGPAALEEVVAHLEEECRRQIEIKEGDATKLSEITETKITIKIAKTRETP